MLQTQTVAPELMELLNFVMNSDVFDEFFLVGGTALALQIGHRKSIDLDFFGETEIDSNLFRQELSKYGSFNLIKQSKNILITNVGGIKTDFINYPYPMIEKPVIFNGIRLASIPDIAAMKLNAISGRGSRKDFIDIFFLMKEFSLNEMINFYLQKYHDGSKFLVIKSLTYFEDAEEYDIPKMFKEFDWEECKLFILNEVKNL